MKVLVVNNKNKTTRMFFPNAVDAFKFKAVMIKRGYMIVLLA